MENFLYFYKPKSRFNIFNPIDFIKFNDIMIIFNNKGDNL
jgi:hypothetical protein